MVFWSFFLSFFPAAGRLYSAPRPKMLAPPRIWRRRAFRSASWSVIILLLVSYTLELAKPQERESAYATRQRLVRFMADNERGDELANATADGPLSRVARAQRLFHHFGGLFAAWAGRFAENRTFERAYLVKHFGGLRLAAAAAFGALTATAMLLLCMAAIFSAALERVRACCAAMNVLPPVQSVAVSPGPAASRRDDETPAGEQSRPAGEQSRSLSRANEPRTRLSRLARRCSSRFYYFYYCSPAEPATRDEPNRVCNTKALALKLPLRPPVVASLKFGASLLVYFSQPDDFFFLFVAFGQIVETGSFRSCGPVAFFCFLFCALEAMAAYRQARHDTELNDRACIIVRPDGSLFRTAWSQVRRGQRVRLLSGESPPCDLLIVHVHGGLRAREKELTGESKPVAKTQFEPELAAALLGAPVAVVAEKGKDALLLADGSRRLDASHQLFRGSTVLLARTGLQFPFVDGCAVRLGHECKMYRECALAATQPPSVLPRVSGGANPTNPASRANRANRAKH